MKIKIMWNYTQLNILNFIYFYFKLIIYRSLQILILRLLVFTKYINIPTFNIVNTNIFGNTVANVFSILDCEKNEKRIGFVFYIYFCKFL